MKDVVCQVGHDNTLCPRVPSPTLRGPRMCKPALQTVLDKASTASSAIIVRHCTCGTVAHRTMISKRDPSYKERCELFVAIHPN